MSWAERRARAGALLDRIGAAIDPLAEVSKLSMPEQQLVEIARALGARARIVIMDEPTASLADKEVDRLFRVIAELKADGVGIIFISHRLDELPKVADRVTALRDGVLVGTRAMADVTRGDLIRMMVGRELSAVFPKTFVEPGEVVLEAEIDRMPRFGRACGLISRARRRDPRACGAGRGGSNRAGSGALRSYARQTRASCSCAAGRSRSIHPRAPCRSESPTARRSPPSRRDS